MPDRKTLNEDLFYRGSSANLPRLHTCENKVPFWDFGQFRVTYVIDHFISISTKPILAIFLCLIYFCINVFYPHGVVCAAVRFTFSLKVSLS